MENIILPFCPKCGTPITSDAKFCPHCGTNVQPLSTSIGRQIYMYIISFLLPPLGLIWVPKYLRSKQQKTTYIALVIIGLTLLSGVASILLVIGYLQGLQSQINGISNFGNSGL